MKFIFSLVFFLLFTSLANGAEKTSVPRFVSLKPNEVNARVGPGPNYPIEWVYLKAGLPVEVIVEFDTWRKIRDIDQAEGWVHQNMLCSKRRGIVRESEVLLHSERSKMSPSLVRLQKGVVLDLLKCQDNWCQVRIHDFKGWVEQVALWGVYPTETLK
ncbi:SH3 domain-containing protein [Kamptonema cortianum]|jgi:SH3-like domain-containing protein|nr:SH3 domain-containing protein [Geitlerinema splendidum]MDK3155655.1 SH3 domain-containing protein [Kamptonema cortianum]